MSEWQTTAALVEVAHKWRRLAERRCAHFVELFHSGRWKRYYTEEKFIHCMREAIRATERWAVIAPPSADEWAASESTEAAPRRDAA